MKKSYLFITFFVFSLDQIIKALISKFLCNITVIPSFLHLTYAKNEGIAFSMFTGSKFLIIIVSIIFVYILLREYNKKIKNKGNFLKISFFILLGGIFGNLFDRIIRGYVVDYISFEFFNHFLPIFNFADICITFGVIVIIFYILFEKEK